MTSWFRTDGSSFLGFVICSLMVVVVVVCAESSRPADSACWSPSVTSCTECLRRGPQCAWCFEEGFLDGAGPNFRCDLLVNLLNRGCGSEFIEQSDIKVKVNTSASSTQVSPQDISITLTAGSEASFIVDVKQLPRYPLDLYYLVDISASMQENLDHLKTVGVALSHRMTELTSNLWLGFGSFVDKPVSPYINVHPSKIDNPCSDYDIRCRPAHGFHHALSMTGNLTEFTRVMKRQRISGNMDTPEGGLDAMLQAAVCQREVGWRPEAKRLLLLMTDQTSHLALDSRLAGIVTPHDGLCHLENNVYTGSTRMDHPSLNQLSDTLLENSIYSIFAVEKQQYQWYEELVSFLPGSYLGKIGLFQAPNLIDLVADTYKRLLSEVAVSVAVEDKAVDRFWVSISPLCPDGSTAKGQSCYGVQPNQTVSFNITIGLHSCPDDDDDAEDVTVMIRPVGYNESSTVRIHSKCRCGCAQTGQCRDSSQSRCGGGSGGTAERTHEEQRPEHGLLKDTSCRAKGDNVDCSGRGVCDCGKCVCEQSKLGNMYGKYCEMDDFSCPYEGGLLCGGRGVCVLGECVCDASWTGATCGCRVSTASCRSPDGVVCSGRGRCVCGECVCDDERYSGHFCERCPVCQSSCQSYWKCVDCQLTHGLTHGEAGHCNHTCTTPVEHTDDVSGLQGDVRIQCVYFTKDGCVYRFQANSEFGRTRLYISTTPECPSHGRLVGTFLSVCALTLLFGLVILAVSRQLLQKKKSWSPEGAIENRGYHCSGKDLPFVPTANEKTVTYRRDHLKERPLEMHIQVPKMPLGESWQC